MQDKIFVFVLKDYVATDNSHELIKTEDDVWDLIYDSKTIDRLINEVWVEEHPEYQDPDFEGTLTMEGMDAQFEALDQLYEDTWNLLVETGVFDAGDYWIYCVDAGTDWRKLKR